MLSPGTERRHLAGPGRDADYMAIGRAPGTGDGLGGWVLAPVPHGAAFDPAAPGTLTAPGTVSVTALAAAGKRLPVRVAEPDRAVVEARFRAEQEGRTPQWTRWASVEAAVDGYMLRETQYGPNRSGYTSTARGPRVPVPVRAADGTVTVVAMPEWARLEGFDWIWEHTGWPVDRPGRIVDPPQNFAPAPGLVWEVAGWLDLAREGRVLGEDYSGGLSDWQTIGWCTSRQDARQIASTSAAHRSSFARVGVPVRTLSPAANGDIPTTCPAVGVRSAQSTRALAMEVWVCHLGPDHAATAW
ncbi:hypothetical protein ACIP88_33735 [Streptomyces uncialis]|uniref:hypothetical protein n=1 Tax=Streptomyces uncialis TaxID=1048205 RepID=UPI0038296B7A